MVKKSIANFESSFPRGRLASGAPEASDTSSPSTATNGDPRDASKPPDDNDESFVSIEEFVPDLEDAGTSNHLNCNHPTTQHSMLKHP